MTAGSAVAITGVGIVSSLGIGAKSFCNDLMNGISGICPNAHGVTQVWAPFAEFDFSTEIKRLNLSEDCQNKVIRTGFRASPPIQATILAVAEAWSQAELSRASPEKIGLIVAGSNVNQLDVFDAYQRSFQQRQVRPSYGAQFMDSHYVGSISEAFSINGEGYTLGGASASSGVALLHGYRALHCSEMEAMVVVGAPMMLSQVELNGFVNIGAHFNAKVPEVHAFACRPFDVEAAGFVYGQGTGVIIFQREQDPAHRTMARMLGGSMCLDGNQSTNPSVDGEVRVMSAALENAGII
ncbi:MAG: beta-ketoacyl synthase N-terminal-like domain-containing protein, partial [Pseudomonadota bacterium]